MEPSSPAPSSHPLYLRSRSLDNPPTHSLTAWTWPPSAASSALLLKAHTGCVNSLALSPCSRLLLSGSDDTHLRLWPIYDLDLDLDLDLDPPRAHSTSPSISIATLTGATRNVFHALFASPTLIISSGADGIVRCHDLNHSAGGPSTAPSLTFADEHADVVQRLATLSERVYLSASDDGSVRVWDVREATKSVGVLQFTMPVSHVDVVHANASEFVVSGEGGLLARFDFRTCFGGSGGGSSRKRKRESEGAGARIGGKRRWRVLRENGPEPVMEYETTDSNIASLALSPDNRHLVALSQYGLPHLYSLTHPTPLASFSHATTPPDPTHPDAFHFSGFSNIATHKVPAFLPTGDHIICGSDDYGMYTWRLPQSPSLSLAPTHTCDPVQVPRATHVLWGYMSLPNRVVPHPDLPYLFSCGVEHAVRVSMFGHGGASGLLPAEGPRALMSADVCMGAFRDVVQGVGEGEADADREERRTVAYFDMVVRQAAKAQARRGEGRGSDSDTDSSEESDSSNESQGDDESMGEWSDVDED